MPTLPLDHPEPLAATLGVMLYPGEDATSQRRARAFTAQLLAEPLRLFHEAGHSLRYEDLVRITSDGGVALDDLDRRRWQGSATGEVFKALWLIARTDESLASWANAIRIAEITAARHRAPGARSAFYEARRRFASVAHLWAAWSIRGRRFQQDESVGYQGIDDFNLFLAEAELLRWWGQSWHPRRAKSKPPLPVNAWRVPDGWAPPERQPTWPLAGGIPDLILPQEFLPELRRPGRPRKAA